jgi:beta-lactamase class A
LFYAQTPQWVALGDSIVAAMVGLYGDIGLSPESLGLVLIAPGASGAEGYAHQGCQPIYPCSMVKSFHLIHALALLEDGRIEPHGEMDRAMRDMIRWSSNTATNYVIDLITGTTGDTLLEGAEYLDWVSKRERLNRFFWRMGWPEWEGSHIAQKLMDDTRYGREAQFAGADGANLNRLTPLACARLFWELFHGDLPLSAPAKARAQAILHRDAQSPDAANPAYQLTDFLCGSLPTDVEICSKAGHNLWTGNAKTSWFKHDMARITAPDRKPLIVVLTTQGQGMSQENPQVFPEIGRLIYEMTAEIIAP